MWKRLVTIIDFFLLPEVNLFTSTNPFLATSKMERDAEDAGLDGARAACWWEGRDPTLQAACLLSNMKRCR